MSKCLTSLLIIAVFTFGGSVAFAKASSGKVQQKDLLELLPDNPSGNRDGRGFCDLQPASMSLSGQAILFGANFVDARAEKKCLLPVPPRDIFENIAWMR